MLCLTCTQSTKIIWCLTELARLMNESAMTKVFSAFWSLWSFETFEIESALTVEPLNSLFKNHLISDAMDLKIAIYPNLLIYLFSLSKSVLLIIQFCYHCCCTCQAMWACNSQIYLGFQAHRKKKGSQHRQHCSLLIHK